jgi:hypothetical protein
MRLSWQPIAADEATALWDELASAFRGATFFHSKTWSEVLQACFSRWVPSPMALEFSDGNILVLPLMSRKTFGEIRIYRESMIPGVYGGPLFLRPPSEQHWHGFWNAVNKVPNITIYGNPFVEQQGFPTGSIGMSTHALDLSLGMGRVLKGFRKGHLAAVKAAQRKGLQIEVASSVDEVKAYFHIYQSALKRWGKEASGFYPERLFQNLLALPGYRNKLKLWIAKHQDTVIAGIWVFYHNDHAVYWHGATDAEYFSYHPAHLLVTAAIEEACENGLHWFDFNPSGGLEGVEHFKRGFGAKRLEFFRYRRLGPVGKAFRVSSQLRQTVLGACPL